MKPLCACGWVSHKFRQFQYNRKFQHKEGGYLDPGEAHHQADEVLNGENPAKLHLQNTL